MAAMVTPMVRDSLKSQILQKRGPMKVDFSPKPAHPLTAAELEKERRRKESNRRSAQKSRLRVKEQEDLNNKKMKLEEAKKASLIAQVHEMERTKRVYWQRLCKVGFSENQLSQQLRKVHEYPKTMSKATGYRSIQAVCPPSYISHVPSSGSVPSANNVQPLNAETDTTPFSLPSYLTIRSAATEPAFAIKPISVAPEIFLANDTNLSMSEKNILMELECYDIPKSIPTIDDQGSVPYSAGPGSIMSTIASGSFPSSKDPISILSLNSSDTDVVGYLSCLTNGSDESTSDESTTLSDIMGYICPEPFGQEQGLHNQLNMRRALSVCM